MRIASRIVGIVLALGGLVFLVMSVVAFVTFRPESVLEAPQFQAFEQRTPFTRL